MAFVYFMTNINNNVLYVGVTSNLARRVWEHKNNVITAPQQFQADHVFQNQLNISLVIAINRFTQTMVGHIIFFADLQHLFPRNI